MRRPRALRVLVGQRALRPHQLGLAEVLEQPVLADPGTRLREQRIGVPREPGLSQRASVVELHGGVRAARDGARRVLVVASARGSRPAR